jgi:hypothetical protein
MSRRIVSFLVVAGALAVSPGGGTAPAGAQTPDATAAFSGNFAGDARDEVFLYSGLASPEPDDVMLAFDNAGTPGGAITITSHPQDVQGTFVPLPGDFDGDGFDEILWYGAGGAPDVLWDFTDFATHTETPLEIRGRYVPAVGDFTADGVDDVFWYAAGAAAPDSLWEFDTGGTFTSVPMVVRGNYFPLVASVGKDGTDDILWYAAGQIPDTLWDFTTGTTRFTTQTWKVVGSYLPFTLDVYGDGPRGGDFFWYAPGPGTDTFWDYLRGTRIQSVTDPVRGFYVPVAGDFFGDNQDDVLWLNDQRPFLWDHNGLLRHNYALPPFSPAIELRIPAQQVARGIASSGRESIAR